MVRVIALKIIFIIILINTQAYAILGPITIYHDTEYRTTEPVINSIASTIELDSDYITKSGAQSFLGLLNTLPSVNLFNAQGNVPAIFLRGTNANHTLLIVDGVRLNDISSVSAAPELETLELVNIKRIEIIKGPYSSLYGSGAIGGVIQVFTKNSTKQGQYSQLNINFASNNSKKYQISTLTQEGNNFIRLSASNYKTDGISARNDNSERDGISNKAIGLKINYQINHKSSIYFALDKTNNNIEYDNCGFGIVNNNCLSIRNFNKISSKISYKPQNNWQSYLIISEVIQDKDLNGFIQDYKTRDLTLLNDIKLESSLLNIGLSKIDDINNTNRQSLSSKDIFAQWQKNIVSIDVNTGVRLIDHSNFDNKTVFNFAVAKYLDNGIKLIAAYGSAFNAPSIFQINYQNTKNLEPESSKNIELGLEKNHNWGLFVVRLYKTTISNLISYLDVDNDNTAPTFNFANDVYINENKLNIKGIELSLNTNIKNYSISINYDFVDSKLAGQNTQQSRRPKNSADINISKQYNKFSSRLQLILKSSSLDVGNIKLNGYTLVNVSSWYNYDKQTKLALSVNNVFNRNYVIANGYNQLGRNLYLGLNYSF